MKWYRADLHIHTVLSPCGSLEMSPDTVIEKAKTMDLDIIAITDHNSLANTQAYINYSKGKGIKVIAGVEVQTIEEIHIVALFDDIEVAMYFDRELYDCLLPLKNNPDFFGDQVIIDENENIIRFEEKALINSTEWSYEETLNRIREKGGHAFPAHVNAGTFSLIGQLGFIPEHPALQALEITSESDVKSLIERYPSLKKYSLLKNSDAHYPEEIGKGFTEYYLKEPTAAEIALAWMGTGNRSLRLCH